MQNDPQSRPKQCWVEAPGGIVLAVKAHPAAKRTMIRAITPAAEARGWPPCRLKISVAANPEQDQANDAIREVLSKHFHVSVAAISLQTGTTARNKKFFITGDPVALTALINPF